MDGFLSILFVNFAILPLALSDQCRLVWNF